MEIEGLAEAEAQLGRRVHFAKEPAEEEGSACSPEIHSWKVQQAMEQAMQQAMEQAMQQAMQQAMEQAMQQAMELLEHGSPASVHLRLVVVAACYLLTGFFMLNPCRYGHLTPLPHRHPAV